MTDTSATTKAYIVTGEILRIWDTTRKTGVNAGVTDRFARISTTLNGRTRELTVQVAAGKPMEEIGGLFVAGQTVSVVGKFRKLPQRENQSWRAEVFQAFRKPYPKKGEAKAAA